MASPIGYLIHPDPAPASTTAAATIRPAAGSRTPLLIPPEPSVPPSHSLPMGRALPSTTRPGSGAGPLPTVPNPAVGHSKTQSLYQCADCLRRYSRPEHLQRHIAAHTLGKRFTCDICSKGFARADLLKRHRANHQDNVGTKRRRFNSAPSSSRVARACQPCAKARVKCEEIKPCTRCKSRGLACEVPSSEDAAMSLVHMSANRTGHWESSPESCYSISSGPGHAPPASSSLMQSVTPEESKEGIRTPAAAPCADEGQLPTPSISNPGNPENYQPHPGNEDEYVGGDPSRPQFSDFLRDVLYDQSLGDPAKPPAAQGLSVLDFYDDANWDFSGFDFGVLDHWSLDGSPSVLDQSSNPPDSDAMTAMRSALVKGWTESPWRWAPQKTDHCYNEQSNLPLPPGDSDSRAPVDRVSRETLHGACRDKVLAVVLSTCRETRMANRVASSFPSLDTLDSWINIFLAAQLCQVSAWIHYGSFSLNSQCPEWLAMAAAAGAVLTPVPAFRRFGFAVQEAVRIAIPERFEEDSRNIAELGRVQALVLVQDLGLWSGNRRKMEIAGCHLSIPVSMMRNRGRFGRSAYADFLVNLVDEGKRLEEEWRRWHQSESWKRLGFHCYVRDAQASMTRLNNPTISYAELTLPLPCARELWFANSADEFKTRCLEMYLGDGRQPPSLGDLFCDINALSVYRHRLDVRFAISIYLYGFWSLIWEYRQLASIHSTSTPAGATASGTASNTVLLLESRRADLLQQLKTFQLVTRGWREMLSAQESMLLHLLLMNLHVSVLDLLLFSGNEGEEQARRVYPALQRWAQSSEGRQALWHAGQIFRQGRFFPRGHLKDFWAVAICHASLCLWTYGVVTRASGMGSAQRQRHPQQPLQQQQPPPPPPPQQQLQQQQQHSQQQAPPHNGPDVFLDAEDSPDVQAWIAHGQQGRPAIQQEQSTQDGPDGQGGRHENGSAAGRSRGRARRPTACPVEDPGACMVAAQEILRANFIGGSESLPPLSENIIVVLRQLEKAAWVVEMG